MEPCVGVIMLGSREKLERRHGAGDRRGWEPMPCAPFVDSRGRVVWEDRRRVPDRRLGNIQVAEFPNLR